MTFHEVYLSLGSNIGDSLATLHSALQLIADCEKVTDLQISQFYKTSPVGNENQEDYVNAACRFKTSCFAQELLKILQGIEKQLGKKPKAKEEPRHIDIDILFFGKESHRDRDRQLEIPHPRWKERLFVLVPLADLTTTLKIPDPSHPFNEISINLKQLIAEFPDTRQKVSLIPLVRKKL